MGEIIKRFTPFVIKTARTTYIRGQEVEDLIQIGQVVIIKAVDMFDVNKSNGFISYVTNTIKRSFYTLIRDNIKKTSYCSLNSLNEEGRELIDTLSSEEDLEESYIHKEGKRMVKEAMDKLSEDEKEIISWFYFKNKTLKDYASFKGKSYRRVADIKKEALISLKRYLEEMDYNGDL